MPLDSEWAKARKDREIVEQAEKQKVKQLTLNMTRRMQEEELEAAAGLHGKNFSGRRLLEPFIELNRRMGELGAFRDKLTFNTLGIGRQPPNQGIKFSANRSVQVQKFAGAKY
uniref:Uncharacterized protein n=1 Tax=Romanomermis culicivorax TaxID=13658 RepID=A0A915J5V0_ROMCU